MEVTVRVRTSEMRFATAISVILNEIQKQKIGE